MGNDDYQQAVTNRSIRTIKAELAFLTDAAVISQDTLAAMLTQLPQEQALHAPVPIQSGAVASKMANLNVNGANGTKAPQQSNGYYDEKSEKAQASTPEPPPPAYPAAPQPPLTYATALYAYTPTDAGDLSLSPNDKVAVTEYMNAEWWKGRSERTGQEGIFPRSYVRVDEKQMPSQPNTQNGTYYGNAPLDVSQSGGGTGTDSNGQPSKLQEGGKKFGKKMGNAAIFGAGATIGSNIVNSIF